MKTSQSRPVEIIFDRRMSSSKELGGEDYSPSAPVSTGTLHKQKKSKGIDLETEELAVAAGKLCKFVQMSLL